MFAESQIYAGNDFKTSQSHKRQFKKSISTQRDVYSPPYNERERRKKQLEDQILNLNQQIQIRQHQIAELKNNISEFYQYQSQLKIMEKRDTELQSEIQDLELFHQKIKRQVRLLQQEEQLIKGKTIVEHNKILEIKQQQASQLQRKEVLEKHLEEVLKGSQMLKKRIKQLKQQVGKNKNTQPLFTQSHLKIQLNKLQTELQNKRSILNKLIKKQQKYVSGDQFRKLKQTYFQLQKQCQIQNALLAQNEKLKRQRRQLQERINFLKNVDIQSIAQKKSLIEQLVQNYHILEKQKLSSQKQLEIYQEQLIQLQNEHQEGIQMFKRNNRKKRQPKGKQKPIAQQQEIKQEEFVKFEEKTVNRWKGKLLRKKCFLGFLMLLIGSLIMGSMTAFR